MKRNYWVVIIIVVALALMGWSGYSNFKSRKQSTAHQIKTFLIPNSNSNKTVQQDLANDEGLPKLRGKVAPGFTLRSIQGKKVSLANYKGKAVLVNFWATWCAPCKIEIPWLVSLHNQYAAQGFQVLGVSEDDPTVTQADLKNFSKQLHMNYPILRGTDAVARKYGGVDFLPTSFYIGRNGKVVAETAGLVGEDEMEANIKKALAARSD